MEWVIGALVAFVVLGAAATMILIARDRRNRSLGEQHAQFNGNASHAEALGRAYAADASRDSGIGTS